MTRLSTDKQRACLERMGIVPPPTRYACSTLIAYVIAGRPGLAREPGLRCATIKKLQGQYLGKRVTSGGRIGTVLYLTLHHSGNDAQSDPRLGSFAVQVTWDSGRSNSVALGGVTLCEETVAVAS